MWAYGVVVSMWACGVVVSMLAYGVVVSMFNFHLNDRGSNPGRGNEISY